MVTVPGALITVHQVSGGVLRAARQCRERQRMGADEHHGPTALWDKLDVDTLLRAGIVQWTFPMSLTVETVAALDLRIKILVATEIVTLSSHL